MKMGNAEEEADESALWLEVLTEAGIVGQSVSGRLIDEADQLTRIFVSSINTARKGKRRENREPGNPEPKNPEPKIPKSPN